VEIAGVKARWAFDRQNRNVVGQLSRDFSDIRDAHSQAARNFFVAQIQGEQIADAVGVAVGAGVGHGRLKRTEVLKQQGLRAC